MDQASPKPSPAPRHHRIPPTPAYARPPLERLRRRVERFVEDLSEVLPASSLNRIRFEAEPFWSHTMTWGDVPPIDIVERDAEYEITAELPGLDEPDIALALSGNRLTLRSAKPKAGVEAEAESRLSGRRHGPFQRAFRVPGDVDGDRIHATFKNGLLTIVLPKKPEAIRQQKTIAISVE